MTKKIIEIDDTLQERIDNATDELKESIKEYICTLAPEELEADNEQIIENWYQGNNGNDKEKKSKKGDDYSLTGSETVYGCDLISEIADSNTPVYNAEINGLLYLYPELNEELNEEFENHGIDRPRKDNAWLANQMAIRLHISGKLHDANKKIFDEFLADLALLNEPTDKK